ncbi:hypothetical protein TrVFT333_009657 [Trichoderma virens FT-333]|nr:hypothetical protein TrVFT333_009657 [Trichoderma virens FT-333]
MDVLPTYQQATTRPDWLQLAAPYIAFADYPSLCRVSRRFWSVFAPRLWRDPCAAIGTALIRISADTTHWWARFMSQKLRQLTPKTRLLIRVLDARGATGPRDFAMYPELTRSAFKLALELLPNVEALVLDDHIGLDVRFLGLNPQQPSPLGRALRILSLNNVTNGVLTVLTSHNNLPQLVYLDISGTPLPNPNETVELLLPKLRILKLRRNGIYADRLYYINIFDRRLWSLDLSDNKLTDRSVQFLLRQLDPRRLLRTSQHKKRRGSSSFGWILAATYPSSVFGKCTAAATFFFLATDI